MKREIKFRVWDKMCNEFSKPSNFTSAVKWFDGCEDNLDYFTIQQYTGHNDSNRIDIYEGDILRSPEGFIREVVWYENDSGWRLKEKSGNVTMNFKGWIFQNEVVGNIFENPELLN